MFDQQNRFVIEDYQQKPPFSSFLPGIAGPKGVPAWCYYNNRGQAVCSFGAQDKDHAILEFCPAHVAYRDNARTGFRTFAKANGALRELFTGRCGMHIGKSEVEITENEAGLSASVVYFGVPGEPVAALARVLTVTNTAAAPIELELLDGLPALVPYGISQYSLKNETQLSKAWMQVEDVAEGPAYFRVRASMADSAKVTRVEGGNFCIACDEAGRTLHPLVQPALVFGQDTGFAAPQNFARTPLADLCAAEQATQNEFPCCFMPYGGVLQPGQTAAVYSLYGQADTKARAHAFAAGVAGPAWFAQKRREAAALTDDLCAAVRTRTADPVFDAYCEQTYLDNLLRGGAPIFFKDGEKTVPFYLYSRKHGDPEREYNYFSMGGEYYAQGNGNYRDVNQNRRSDVLFFPQLGAANIYTFFDLIQLDGYNPLVIKACDYTLDPAAAAECAALAPEAYRAEALALLGKPFTPGALAMKAEQWGLADAQVDALTAKAVCAAHSEPNADFSEGYWCDHWTYNLDLIESYLAVYPEKRRELLFGSAACRWYETRVLVNPREKRYEMTENGLRQYHALDAAAKQGVQRKWMCVQQGAGSEARSTLAEKLVLLCAVKTATLDAAGLGVEMEGGKPGWYDALNGLPGLLGSSMAESCELARLLAFTAAALEEQPAERLALYREIAQLARQVDEILQAESEPFARWQALNGCKERYRAATLNGVEGEREALPCAELAAMLRRWEAVVRAGIARAVEIGGGICPTYFTFAAEGVQKTAGGLLPAALKPQALPLFLEGPVRWLKLDAPAAEKQALARRVRQSGLYDEALSMYKVNESLAGVSFEAGRALAFTPGWLENESVWLHMEYKYLLELLKSGLYDEYDQALRTAAVPFLKAESYGRSPLENVSFIASSANPNPALRGKGFVARLSGSTAEFLQMWQIMFFGAQPFRQAADGTLALTLAPSVPEYLMPADGRVQAAFLSGVAVTYHTEGLPRLRPGETHAAEYCLTYADGRQGRFAGDTLPEAAALAVRGGQVSAIDVQMA